VKARITAALRTSPNRPRESHEVIQLFESDVAPVQDEPIDEGQVEAPEVDGTSEDTEGFEAPDFTDIPEEYRGRISEIEREFKSQYTKKTQELAEERKQYEAAKEQIAFVESLQNDPDVQKALLKELAALQGYEFPEDENEVEPQQEEEAFEDPRLTELLARLEEQETMEAHEHYLNQIQTRIENDLSSLEEEHGRKFSDDEKDVIVNYALAAADDEQESPDIAGAFERLAGIEAGWKKRYIETKKAPYVAGGTSGSEAESYDFNNRSERLAHMTAVAQAHVASQNT